MFVGASLQRPESCMHVESCFSPSNRAKAIHVYAGSTMTRWIVRTPLAAALISHSKNTTFLSLLQGGFGPARMTCMAKKITLATVINEMQRLHQLAMSQHAKTSGELLSLKDRIYRFESRVDQKFALIGTQISNIDDRLDTIEISIVEQKHETRIRRLEKHTNLTKAA